MALGTLLVSLQALNTKKKRKKKKKKKKKLFSEIRFHGSGTADIFFMGFSVR